MNRLLEKYKTEVVPALNATYHYSSIMETPKVAKVVINMGVGDATSNAKLLEDAVKELTAISGQKPIITKAKKSIATFKLRQGMEIGCKVTLRGEKMYEFLEEYLKLHLMAEVDTLWVSKNKLSSQKLTMNKLIELEEWIFVS